MPSALRPGRTDELLPRPDQPEIRGTLTVSVKNSQGQGMNGATVRVEARAPTGFQLAASGGKRADRNGEFRFENLPPGDYRVVAGIASFGESTTEVRMLPGVIDTLAEVVLHPSARGKLEFVLTLQDGRSPTQVWVGVRDNAETRARFSGRFKAHDQKADGLSAMVNASQATYPYNAANGLHFLFPVGARPSFEFACELEGRRFWGEHSAQVTAEPQRLELMLRELTPDEKIGHKGFSPPAPVRYEATFRMDDGGKVSVRRASLRRDINSAEYTLASETGEGRAVWAQVEPGTWWLACEADEFQGPFLAQVELRAQASAQHLIRTGKLELLTQLDPQAAAPSETDKAPFQVRVAPRGSGALQLALNRAFAQPADRRIELTLPEGSWLVTLAPQGKNWAFSPPQQQLSVTPGTTTQQAFTLRAAATLEFRAVDSGGFPVPGVEFIVSRNPRGELTDAERQSVSLGAADGFCRLEGAPEGEAYLHIWSQSQDWREPDKVFLVRLPAGGTLNLGNIELRP
jgi:hypothetical protein